MNNQQQRETAKHFAEKWKDKGYEKGDTQIFWTELLGEIFGIEDISQYIKFEDKVLKRHMSFIDAYISTTSVLIEQTAQRILNARALYPNSSLATLYDEPITATELLRAHEANDHAVMQAYGFVNNDKKGEQYWFTEEECVAKLMTMYRDITSI